MKKTAIMCLLIVGCSKGETGSALDSGSQVPPPAPPPTQEQMRLAKLKEAIDLPEMSAAFAGIKSEIDDGFNKESDGTLAFQLWATSHMKWSDVSVEKNETSFAAFQKDPDEGRGKRVCVSGKIIQIAKVDKRGFNGLMMSGSGNLFHFFAVGSTGELVAQSYGQFCGVLLQKYDYSNSGGGTGHALSIVGMFDLPENRAKK